VLEVEEQRGRVEEGDGSDAKRHRDDFSGILGVEAGAVGCEEIAEELGRDG
jgi:hypothetical protein